MKPYAWLGDKLISTKDKTVSGKKFLRGRGLFETMRVYNGSVFLLERHIRRLIGSCAVMDIAPPKFNLLYNAVAQVVYKNKLSSAYARLDVWKKKKGAGIFVFAKSRRFYKDKDYKKGLRAAIIYDERQDERSPLARVKSLDRNFYTLMKRKAEKSGADEAIILNGKGNICEGARTNLFIVRKGKIFTPFVYDGCLPGIMRRAVMEIARKLKIKVRQKHIKPVDLFSSDEAFLTNSLIEVMPLTRVDNKPIGKGRAGVVTLRILDKYRSLVRENYK